MYDTILPAAGMFLFLALVRGYAGDDDNEELARLAMSSLCDFGSQRIPIFGSNVGDGLMSLMGMGEGSQKRGGVRTTLDTPVQLWSVATGRAGRALHEASPATSRARQLVYAAADIASFLARVPVSKLARNAERGWTSGSAARARPFPCLCPGRGGSTKKRGETHCLWKAIPAAVAYWPRRWVKWILEWHCCCRQSGQSCPLCGNCPARLFLSV